MQYVQLETLVSAYYHQDWVDLGMWETLDLYLDDSTSHDVRQLQAELQDVLSSMSEAATKSMLDSWYLAMDLGDSPGGYRGWLEEIARRVSTAA